MALLSDTWFNRSESVVETEEMSKFCEHVAIYMDQIVHSRVVKEEGVTVLFGILRSPEWRKHIATRSWRVLAYCILARDTESVRWCLENAIELLEFTKGLPHGEGSKWWYGTLWLCYNRLNTTVRDEVKRIAADMLNGDGLSDLNLYLSLMQEELTRLRQELNVIPESDFRSRFVRLSLIALEGNYDQLARSTGKR